MALRDAGDAGANSNHTCPHSGNDPCAGLARAERGRCTATCTIKVFFMYVF